VRVADFTDPEPKFTEGVIGADRHRWWREN
jgi:hypothetical protein